LLECIHVCVVNNEGKELIKCPVLIEKENRRLANQKKPCYYCKKKECLLVRYNGKFVCPKLQKHKEMCAIRYQESSRVEDLNKLTFELHSLCERVYSPNRQPPLDRVEYLLEEGADVYYDYKKYPLTRIYPLLRACQNGYIDVVKLILVKRNIKNLDFELANAAWFDKMEMCKFLISKGANLMLQYNGESALRHYGQDSSIVSCEELIKLRCDELVIAWKAGPHQSQVKRREKEASSLLIIQRFMSWCFFNPVNGFLVRKIAKDFKERNHSD
jgi:hypothetical protein